MTVHVMLGDKKELSLVAGLAMFDDRQEAIEYLDHLPGELIGKLSKSEQGKWSVAYRRREVRANA